jgi:hypothetical protein
VLSTQVQGNSLTQSPSSARNRPGRLRKWQPILAPENLHFFLTGVALVFLIPILHRVHLPLRWDLDQMLNSYIILAVQSAVLATVLYSIQNPKELLISFRKQYWRNKPKLLILAAFVATLVLVVGAKFAILITIETLAVLELLHRDRLKIQNRQERLTRRIIGLLPAAAYLFFGLILVFTYNNVIVRVRYYGAYDEFFNWLDVKLLGTTVSALAHHAAEALPSAILPALNFIYFGMFPQIGTTLILCGMLSGRRRAMQFVGAVLFANYLALTIFYLWPSHGPYLLCSHHFERLRYDLSSYLSQKNMLANARYLWQQKPVHSIPMAFYIAFPCMHIAQPLVVLWFLRKWKRIATLFVAYDVLLLAAILLLEWHYFVDLLGGVAVAAVTIFVMGRDSGPRAAEKQIAWARTAGPY